MGSESKGETCGWAHGWVRVRAKRVNGCMAEWGWGRSVWTGAWLSEGEGETCEWVHGWVRVRAKRVDGRMAEWGWGRNVWMGAWLSEGEGETCGWAHDWVRVRAKRVDGRLVAGGDEVGEGMEERKSFSLAVLKWKTYIDICWITGMNAFLVIGMMNWMRKAHTGSAASCLKLSPIWRWDRRRWKWTITSANCTRKTCKPTNCFG